MSSSGPEVLSVKQISFSNLSPISQCQKCMIDDPPAKSPEGQGILVTLSSGINHNQLVSHSPLALDHSEISPFPPRPLSSPPTLSLDSTASPASRAADSSSLAFLLLW